MRWALVAMLLFWVVGFVLGWYLHAGMGRIVVPKALRLGGYQFIDPLLLCNMNNSNAYSENKLLSKEMQTIIDINKRSGIISKTSVYFADLKNGTWANVYGDEQYYPSSLGKIPLMMAYYQMAENSPDILTQQILYPLGSTDLNQMQDMQPKEAIDPGHSYAVEQLIEYMIKYSDNNATALLDANINASALNRVYGDLGIPSKESVNLLNLDFMTVRQVSTMFRVLYNATYLSRDYSEKALKLLSQSSFTQGLAAGVAPGTRVSHKLGLVGIASDNVTTEHELHDCGIVYAKDPYLVCVMTRGTAPLSQMESVVSQISKVVYSSVQGGE